MNKWLTVIMVLLILYIVGSFVAMFVISRGNSLGDKIVIFSINGVISTSNNDFFGQNAVDPSEVVKEIKDLDKDKSVKGIIFEIDSPGGDAVASQEIADAIKKLDKKNYAVIRSVGASGAYWIASASDKIIASPMSITGSIGVLSSYLQFSELFEKYGVNYERLVGGEYKDLGSPFRELTDDERRLLQKKIKLVHEFFIGEVAKNRNLSVDYVTDISTGEFYMGQEALALDLIDELGDRDKAIEMMKKELNLIDVNIVERKHEKTLFDVLLGKVSFNFGRGFASYLVESDLKNRFEIRT